MSGSMKQLVLGATLALGLICSVQAQQAAPGGVAAAASGAPAGFVAPELPAADESNAVRSKTQPGNNAPVWRAVRDSGTTPGYSNLPGAEMGVLMQPFVQYPGSQYTTAGEAWRQVRNNWIMPYGGSLIVIIVLAIGLFYWRRGPHGRPPARHRPQDRALHALRARRALGHGDQLRDPGRVGHRDGVRQVLPAAGAGGHAVRLAELRSEDGAQLCRPAVRGGAA